jgi:hypothetical protein
LRLALPDLVGDLDEQEGRGAQDQEDGQRSNQARVPAHAPERSTQANALQAPDAE